MNMTEFKACVRKVKTITAQLTGDQGCVEVTKTQALAWARIFLASEWHREKLTVWYRPEYEELVLASGHPSGERLTQ